MTFIHLHLVTNGPLDQLMYCWEFRGVNLIIRLGNPLYNYLTGHQPLISDLIQLILNFLCLLGKRETNEIEKQPKVKK